jgi:hypothetical protein
MIAANHATETFNAEVTEDERTFKVLKQGTDFAGFFVD